MRAAKANEGRHAASAHAADREARVIEPAGCKRSLDDRIDLPRHLLDRLKGVFGLL